MDVKPGFAELAAEIDAIVKRLRRLLVRPPAQYPSFADFVAGLDAKKANAFLEDPVRYLDIALAGTWDRQLHPITPINEPFKAGFTPVKIALQFLAAVGILDQGGVNRSKAAYQLKVPRPRGNRTRVPKDFGKQVRALASVMPFTVLAFALDIIDPPLQ